MLIVTIGVGVGVLLLSNYTITLKENNEKLKKQILQLESEILIIKELRERELKRDFTLNDLRNLNEK